MNIYRMPRKFRAMCPDGVIRTATETGEAGVWFATNAAVHYKGKTVTGAVSTYSDVPTDDDGNMWDDAPTDKNTGERTIYVFSPYIYMKNGALFTA